MDARTPITPTTKKNMAAKNSGRNLGPRVAAVLWGESVALTIDNCTEREKSMIAFLCARGTLVFLATPPAAAGE